jgi:hypothetical protein
MKKSYLIFPIIFIFAMLMTSCKKEEQTIDNGYHDADNSPSLASTSVWQEITSKRKKGCKLYKKGSSNIYVQEIDFAQYAQIKLFCNSVLVNSNFQPIGSTNASSISSTSSSPWVEQKTVADWWTNGASSTSINTRLWSFTNASFFGYPNGPVCKSSMPVKASGVIKTCGTGCTPVTQAKRVFYINWNSSTRQQTAGVSTINLGLPSGNGSLAYYPYNSINTALANYTTAIVGFDPLSPYGSGCPNSGRNGRTYIGVNSTGTKVYIYTANFDFSSFSSQCLLWEGATQQQAHDDLLNLGCPTSKIVMLDGSGSSQMTCLSQNYMTGDSRKVASCLYVSYGE